MPPLSTLRRRRHSAAHARVAATVLSAGSFLGIVAGMAAARATATPAPATSAATSSTAAGGYSATPSSLFGPTQGSITTHTHAS